MSWHDINGSHYLPPLPIYTSANTSANTSTKISTKATRLARIRAMLTQPHKLFRTIFNNQTTLVSTLDSPLPYTVAAAAKVNRKQQRWMNRKINKLKAAFRRPEIRDLKHELSTLDISTNKYLHTTSHTIPLNEKSYYPTLGKVVSSQPDMKRAVELVEFQVGTSTHRHIRSWKRRLRGTIITTINDETITSEEDIKAVIQRACNNKQTTIKIEFGSLVGFAMSGEGVPTLQSDQLNVIAHHLNSINNEEDIWVDKTEWPQSMDSDETVRENIRVNVMKRNKLKLTPEWDAFLKSEQ
jgi:hypothetical protein